jgi:ribosomal-protein-alanine N-acetyltransferase
MKIVALGPEDLEAMLAIERASFKDPWTREMFLFEFQEEKLTRVWGAKTKEAPSLLVGYICIMAVVDEMDINNIAVHPAYRRRGAAKKLMQKALQWAKGRGVKKAFLEVRPSNQEALKFYQKLNFKPLGVRKRYYANGEDAWVLIKDI